MLIKSQVEAAAGTWRGRKLEASNEIVEFKDTHTYITSPSTDQELLQRWSHCTFKSCPSASVWPQLMHSVGFPGGSVVKNLPAMQETQETGLDPWVGKIPGRRKQ